MAAHSGGPAASMNGLGMAQGNNRGSGGAPALARWLRVFVAVFVVLCPTRGHATPPLQVALMVTDTGTFSVWGQEMHTAATLWKEHVREIGGIGPQRQLLNFTWIDVESSVAVASQKTSDLLAGKYGNINFVVGPFSSVLTEAIALVLETHTSPPFFMATNAGADSLFRCDELLLPPCTRPGFIRFTKLRGMSSVGSQFFLPFLSLMRILQASTVVLMEEDDPFLIDMCNGAATKALQVGMDVLHRVRLPRHNATLTDANREELRKVVQIIKPFKSDIVIGCTRAVACAGFVEASHAMDFNANAMAFSLCLGSGPAKALGNLMNFVHGPTQWDYRLEGTAYIETALSPVRMFEMVLPSDPRANANNTIPSARQFYNAYRALRGVDPPYQTSVILQAMYAIQNAITIANSTDPVEALRAHDLTQEPSFAGMIASSRLGANLAKEMVTWQMDENGKEMLTTPLNLVKVVPAIYPTPKWNERVYTHSMYARTEERILLVLVAVMCTSIVALMIYLWRHRQRSIFRHSSVLFGELTLFGLLVLCASVLTWPIENNATTCMLRPWMMGLGIVLCVAPLAAKTDRIAKIFNTKILLKRLAISDRDVMLRALGMLFPAALLVALWTALDPMTVHVVVADKYRPALNVAECRSNHTELWSWLLVAYTGLILVFTSITALRTHAVWQEFNDARHTHLAVYTICVCFVVLVLIGVSSVSSSDRSAWFDVRSALILMMAAGLQSVLFVPKILLLSQYPARPRQRKARVVPIPPGKPTSATAASKDSIATPPYEESPALGTRNLRLVAPRTSSAATTRNLRLTVGSSDSFAGVSPAPSSPLVVTGAAARRDLARLRHSRSGVQGWDSPRTVSAVHRRSSVSGRRVAGDSPLTLVSTTVSVRELSKSPTVLPPQHPVGGGLGDPVVPHPPASTDLPHKGNSRLSVLERPNIAATLDKLRAHDT